MRNRRFTLRTLRLTYLAKCLSYRSSSGQKGRSRWQSLPFMPFLAVTCFGCSTQFMTDIPALEPWPPVTGFTIDLESSVHESERPGRRAKDWRSSSRIVEPCWFWTAWSRSKTSLSTRTTGTRSFAPWTTQQFESSTSAYSVHHNDCPSRSFTKTK